MHPQVVAALEAHSHGVPLACDAGFDLQGKERRDGAASLQAPIWNTGSEVATPQVHPVSPAHNSDGCIFVMMVFHP